MSASETSDFPREVETVENPASDGAPPPRLGTGNEPEDPEDPYAMLTFEVDAAKAMARLGAAPTNWHQATIYFLTAKSEEDAVMRKRAPLMFAWGGFLVIMQISAVLGMLGAMLHPSCTSNSHCNGRDGFYCYTIPGKIQGNCQMCGEAAPLPIYLSSIPVPNPVPDQRQFKEYNTVWDQHYPNAGAGGTGRRTTTPDWSAGFNFTMVRETCTPPVSSFNYGLDKEGTLADRGDLPDWIRAKDIDPVSGDLAITHYTSASVARWCAACVQERGLDEEDGFTQVDEAHEFTVSLMNKRLLAMSNADSMAKLDWVALVLCAYVVGLNVAGEIKDIQLCEMAYTARLKELSVPWQVALAVLGRVRGQVFLAGVMGAVPGVVLTQGGSAMAVAFNSIAILFICDIDNLSYQYGLSEHLKERVDTYGHVLLHDNQAKKLSTIKVICTIASVLGTIYLVLNGASVGAMISGGGMTVAFKLSELITDYKTMTSLQIARFVLITFVVQAIQTMFFIRQVLSWYNDH